MRKITRGASANAGLIFHIFVQDSTSTSGAGKASLAFSDFSCRYIRNGEALSGAITPQDITTIGTYAAPTANTNIRIKAVDNTNAIGIYEVQIHADWVNTTNSCQSLTIFLTASGAATLPIQIPLVADDEQVAKPTNFNLTSIDANGRLDIIKMAGTTLTGRDIGASVLLSSGTGTGQIKISSGYVAPNWGDVGNPTTTLNLSGTTVKAVTDAVSANVTQISGDSGAADALETMLDGTGGNTLSLAQLRMVNSGGVGLYCSSSVGLAAQFTGSGGVLIEGGAGVGLNITASDPGIQPVLIQSLAVSGNANAIELTPTGTGYGIAGTLQTIATGGITSGSFAASAINAAAIATGAIDADALAADAVGEIADGVWGEAIAGHLSVGSTGAALNAAGAAGDPWATALPGAYVAGTAGFIIGNNLDASVADVEADTQNIQLRLPAALVGGRMDANTQATAASLAFNLTGNVTGNLSGSVGSVTGAVGSVTGAVGSVTGNVGGSVASVAANGITASSLAADAITEIQNGLATSVEVGDIPTVAEFNARSLPSADYFVVGDYTVPPTANENADALLDRADAVETAVTPRGALRALLAALAGVATGGGTNTIVLKNPAGGTTRVTLSVDLSGNRTSSTLNV